MLVFFRLIFLLLFHSFDEEDYMKIPLLNKATSTEIKIPDTLINFPIEIINRNFPLSLKLLLSRSQHEKYGFALHFHNFFFQIFSPFNTSFNRRNKGNTPALFVLKSFYWFHVVINSINSFNNAPFLLLIFGLAFQMIFFLMFSLTGRTVRVFQWICVFCLLLPV